MIYRWWSKLIRSNTKSISADKAVLWKRRLSIAYGLIAWHAFGFVAYMIYNGKADWAHYYGLKSDEEKNIPPAQSWAATLGISNAKVLRVSGFKKVGEYDIIDGELANKQETQEFNID